MTDEEKINQLMVMLDDVDRSKVPEPAATLIKECLQNAWAKQHGIIIAKHCSEHPN